MTDGNPDDWNEPREVVAEEDAWWASPDELAQPAQRIDGVVIGVLVGFGAEREALVAFPGNPNPAGIAAKATVSLGADDIGCQLALVFENGAADRPLVIGRIVDPQAPRTEPPVAEVDGERVVFEAEREIVLRCGKASITLTRAGKILIRGTYVLSRSSGANRIKGGSVQIN